MPRLRPLLYCLVALACGVAMQASAQSVALTGMLGNKALLVVDGSPPKAVPAGESYRGVKVVSTQGDSVQVEIDGKRQTLRLGDAPTSVGGGGAGASGTRIVLSADSGGHFMVQGQINGKATTMVVDTGATGVVIAESEAQRMGLKYNAGLPMKVSTANGVVPAWYFKIGTLKVGDVVAYDVDGVVTTGSMPYVLLGNSFLSRFQMTRTNDQMVLEKRY
ncbi:TIGR02281 family clan AA aspartic protease [Curvibacter sp. APW13]|uniref:retropepsin-like aspartic protease family protein n=1 Tax=Curvibacter sp. APW13 TaxID=3077236 RepID=UPI0028DF39B1|nr:TIGR02281 family clan AA aspartic protease [Curvibacter sp. APW13]MDT8990878.1 TIGR02281 family clan AA aspartic protease [Curvibacter sp. APW13]